MSKTSRLEPLKRDGLQTVAGILVAVAQKLRGVADGTEDESQIANAAAVLEGQAVVLREWYEGASSVVVEGEKPT
jgi:hypothetical protein